MAQVEQIEAKVKEEAADATANTGTLDSYLMINNNRITETK